MQQQAWWNGATRRNDVPLETPEVLYLRYQCYRRRQVTRLLHLVPRDAIRELYGQARAWASERGLHDARDPMATLSAFAEHLLPLPSFEVWQEDRARHPLSHIEDGGEDPRSDEMVLPRRLEDRRFHYGGRSWTASLNVFRDGAMWRGFLRFREVGRGRRYHTANIFLEETARKVRQRFREFDRGTLGAFLRSVLP